MAGLPPCSSYIRPPAPSLYELPREKRSSSYHLWFFLINACPGFRRGFEFPPQQAPPRLPRLLDLRNCSEWDATATQITRLQGLVLEMRCDEKHNRDSGWASKSAWPIEPRLLTGTASRLLERQKRQKCHKENNDPTPSHFSFFPHMRNEINLILGSIVVCVVYQVKNGS